MDFVTAAEIFDDPDLLVVIDSRAHSERQYQAIGDARRDPVRCVHDARKQHLPDHQREEAEPS